MLTKELLEVTKYRPNITPEYREIEEYNELAGKVIETYQEGRTRGEIDEEVSGLETHDTFKLVRGLSRLLERRSRFEQRSDVPPERLRKAAFDRGYVTGREEREEVLKNVGTEFGVDREDVEKGLWADREENEALVKAPEISPEQLLKQYNLSLTQTLLFDALELEFTASGNFQEIFGLMKYLGLMYTVDRDVNVNATGPASLFKKTRKYGTELAKLLPSIMKTDKWSVSAQVETEVSGETRVYEFSLDSDRKHLFPEQTEAESYDSEVERDFATRIGSLADGWNVEREPTILRAGNRVMIPDFSFEREREDEEFFLEVVGFWTPEYLEEKVEKVRAVETEKPMLLAVNENLNCTKEDFDADKVFFYNRKIPVKPVLKRLNRIEEAAVKRDLEELRSRDIDAPEGEATEIEKMAKEEGVEPKALKRYLKSFPGIVSSGTYLPEAVVDELKEKIGALDSRRLSDVNPVLERYGVAQDALEEIGYSIHYTSLNQDKATISKEK